MTPERLGRISQTVAAKCETFIGAHPSIAQQVFLDFSKKEALSGTVLKCRHYDTPIQNNSAELLGRVAEREEQ